MSQLYVLLSTDKRFAFQNRAPIFHEKSDKGGRRTKVTLCLKFPIAAYECLTLLENDKKRTLYLRGSTSANEYDVNPHHNGFMNLGYSNAVTSFLVVFVYGIFQTNLHNIYSDSF